MTRFFLAAGVAALAITAPVMAKPDGERGDRRAAKVERGDGGQRAQRAERRAQRSEVRSNRGAERRAQRSEVRSNRGAERRQLRVAQREERGNRAERQRDRREVRAQRSERRNEVRPQRAERREVREERRANREVRQQRAANRVERRDVRQQRTANRVDRRELRQERVANRIDPRELRQDRLANRLERRDLRQERIAQRIAANDVIRARDVRNIRTAGWGDWPNGCPPGLVNKNELCMPPGQYRKQVLNQALPVAYRSNTLPVGLRDIYRDTDDYYWRYGDGYAYRVDRDTQLVRALLPLLTGGYAVGQTFPSMYMNSYVPSYYDPFYYDTDDSYYRYANGYIYEIDPYTGLIEDIDPAYGYGYGVGQMWPSTYSYYNVPYQYRSLYYDTPDYYYRYAPGAIYQVDRDSMLITAVASLLTGGGLSIGQPLPIGYDAYNVPYGYRDQYYDTADSWYRYNNGYIYQVDPTTRLVTAIIEAIV